MSASKTKQIITKSDKRRHNDSESDLDSGSEYSAGSSDISNTPNTATKVQLDIKVSKIKYQKLDGFVSSKLILKLEGHDMNLVVANTIRRVAYDDIPVYAFNSVNIEQNTSKAFDNDYMRCRLRQLPMYPIENTLFYLEPEYLQNLELNQDLDKGRSNEKTRLKHSSEKLIEVFINAANNTKDIKSITSNDLTYLVDGKQEKYPHNREFPILLIDLLPGQVFKCHMVACLGVGECDAIWSGCKQIYYEQIEPVKRKGKKPSADSDAETESEEDLDIHNIKFTVESIRQMSEIELLVKCCKFIKFKLGEIRKFIKLNVHRGTIAHNQMMLLELIDEDHTLGNLINHTLQDHPDIIYSGLSKPDLLIKAVTLKIISSDDVESPIEPLYAVIQYLIDVYDLLEKKFLELD
jgi:DNA-directed RNA polymerase subunit L